MRLDIDPVKWRAYAMRQWGYDTSYRPVGLYVIEHDGDSIRLDGVHAELTLYIGRGAEFPQRWRIPIVYYLNDQKTAIDLLSDILRDIERFGIPQDATRIYE